MKFGDRLGEVITAQKLTPTALAARIGATQQLMNKWLNADNVELQTLLRLAKGLGVPVETLCEHIDCEYDAMRAQQRAGLERVQELWPRVVQFQGDLLRIMENMATVRPPAGGTPPADPSGSQTDPNPALAGQ